MVTYRTAGAWGAGKGSRLTKEEIDANFYELELEIAAIEAEVAAGANPISNITSSGSSIYIHLTSGTVYGPLALPQIRWNDAGAWAAGRTYYANDVVSIEGDGLYHVLEDHVSDNEFDAAATGSNGDLYSLLLSAPNPAPVFNISAASLLLTAEHANAYIRCSNAAGTSVYLEAGTFADNTEIHFRQTGDGQITIVIGDSGTLLNAPVGFDVVSDGQGATFCIKHVGGDEWDAFGNLAELTT